MTSAITRLTEKFKVSEVEDVIVSTVTASDGKFVRALRIYGSAGTAQPPVIEIVLEADEPEKIMFAVPASEV